jgi:hypothetical protein
MIGLLVGAQTVRGDAFDRYVNPVLKKAPGMDGVIEVKELTPALIADNDRVLPNTPGALVIVHTNDNRYSKLLVQTARQRIGDDTLPILLIDRFVTYKEGEERTVQAEGKNVHLFGGFRFNLDLGQVVPAALGGDLHFVAKNGKAHAEVLGKAKMYLVTKPLPGTEPKKSERLQIGETFEPRYFNGTYKLHDDGRRSGELTLKVEADGQVTGAFYSDRDGSKYDVFGKIGSPKHAIQFTIKFPRTEEVFQGCLFTGDGKAIAGTARLQERETGFYAVRVEEK